MIYLTVKLSKLIIIYTEYTRRNHSRWRKYFIFYRIYNRKLQKQNSTLSDLTSNFMTLSKRERILSRLNLSVKYTRRARRTTVDVNGVARILLFARRLIVIDRRYSCVALPLAYEKILEIFECKKHFAQHTTLYSF